VTVETAIVVDDVWKKFRLYDERNQSLKAAMMRGRRARYREFDALKGISFEVARGSTFGLIGENGSGKSTLLKCIARILRPERGLITSTGKISALLELGAGFHPELSGRENVYLNGAILGLSKKQLNARFDEIVGFAGLEQFIDSPVKNYSSGMYVRLGFSVAINVDPDILLVDEVLAVGDESFQRKCMEKFADLKESGKTIVVVSHALGTMRTLCDQLALLEHGNLVDVGEAGTIVDEYMTEVHEDRVRDGAHGTRWGSGEARVSDIELLDAQGRPTRTVRTGDAVTFRLHFEADEPIDEPVFGLALYTLDGVQVTGPNTRDEGYDLARIEGTGHVDFHVPRLMLVRGIYDLSVALADHALLHTYDQRHRAFRFDVERGDPHDQFGVVSLGGSWSGTGSPVSGCSPVSEHD
jgi:ABC-type polysaccharide/polyol phosphate transport system ATPase subunit